MPRHASTALRAVNADDPGPQGADIVHLDRFRKRAGHRRPADPDAQSILLEELSRRTSMLLAASSIASPV